MVYPELLAEFQTLEGAAIAVADLVRAPAGPANERLEMSLAHVRIAVERGVRRGATIAMVVAEAHSRAVASLVSPIGEDLAGYSHLLPGYEETADFVLGLASADQILGGGQ